MTTNKHEYTNDSIRTFGDMEYIRLRPNNLLPSMDTQGMIHMLWEYISNSMDEIVQRPDGGTILVVLCRNLSTQEFQIVIRDDGRGLPIDRLKDSYTKLKTSGKISENSAYNSTAGQFGMGAKAGAALSKHFRAISKHYLSEKAASLQLKDGVVVDHHQETVSISNGVTLILQPDVKQFFPAALDFSTSGYLDLVALCRKLNIFNTTVNFNLFVIDKMLPARIWTDDCQSVFDTITEYINSRTSHCEYSSEQVPDKSDYLFEIWKTNSAVIFRDSFDKLPAHKNDKLGFGARVFLTKRSAYGNTQYFISVNNVVLEDKTNNSVTITFTRLFRELISERIEDPKLKKFVLEEYSFPTLYIAIGVMYHGAQLGGTTKNTFRDQVFAEQFYNEVRAIYLAKDQEFWDRLMETILPDIQARYASYYDIPAKKQDILKDFLLLNNPRNFSECRSTDNTKTELFIVEGTSAGNIISTRNNEYQAVYLTRGKPYNAATRPDQLLENRKRLLKDPIYQDIIKILHIDPNTTNLKAQSRFSKIIIATDADPDGYHIRSLHINNLYIINPLIVTSGMVWLANPPLYSMQITQNRFLFLRDKNAMMDAKIKFIYKPSIAFRIKTNTPSGERIVEPDEKLYRETCFIIEELGKAFELAAKQLNIPLLILERLFYAIKYLYPRVDPDNLAKYFESRDADRFVTVDYNVGGNYLVVSVGHEDYPIGLNEIGETLVNYLLPLTKKFKYNDLFFEIRGVNSHSTIKEFTTVSPMQLYMCLKQLSSIVNIHRYKGLGEMPTESCFETIMDPATRSLTQVKDVGSFEDNYGLLGKNSAVRKSLLTESGSLVASFVQQQRLEQD